MSSPHPDNSCSCDEARQHLQHTWAEGNIDDVVNGESASPTGSPLARHLEVCATCKQEIEKIASLEKVIAEGFRELGRSTSLPSEDQFARMLREVRTRPETRLIKRIRRSLRPVVWFTFFLFSLLAFCILAAAAYRTFMQ